MLATTFGALFGIALLHVQPETFEPETTYAELAPRAASSEPEVLSPAYMSISADSLPSFTETISSTNASDLPPIDPTPTVFLND